MIEKVSIAFFGMQEKKAHCSSSANVITLFKKKTQCFLLL